MPLGDIYVSSNFELRSQRPLDSRTNLASIAERDTLILVKRYNLMRCDINDGTDRTFRLVLGTVDTDLMNNSNWVEIYNSTGSPSLVSLSDTNITSPVALHFLKYNASTSMWYNTAIIATDITLDSTHRFVTDVDIANWNAAMFPYRLYQPNGTNPFVYTDNGGALHIDGDIIQSGSSYETHVEQIYTTDDLIITRDGAVGGLSAGEYTGFQATLYDGINDGQLVFDNTGTARVGDVGSTQAIGTREDTPINTGISVWDAGNTRFITLTQNNAFNKNYSGSGGDHGTSDNIARGDHTHSSLSLATLTRGDGLTGSNYDGSTARTWAVSYAGSGGSYGTATTVARSDHSHSSSHGSWQTPSYETGYSDYTSLGHEPLRYRLLADGQLQIIGAVTQINTAVDGRICILPSGFRPTALYKGFMSIDGTGDVTTARSMSVHTDGDVYIYNTTFTGPHTIHINAIIPID